MNKKIIYLIVFLVIALFVISSCQKQVARRPDNFVGPICGPNCSTGGVTSSNCYVNNAGGCAGSVMCHSIAGGGLIYSGSCGFE